MVGLKSPERVNPGEIFLLNILNDQDVNRWEEGGVAKRYQQSLPTPEIKVLAEHLASLSLGIRKESYHFMRWMEAGVTKCVEKCKYARGRSLEKCEDTNVG